MSAPAVPIEPTQDLERRVPGLACPECGWWVERHEACLHRPATRTFLYCTACNTMFDPVDAAIGTPERWTP